MAKVPVIAMTANVMRGDREKTLAAGCDGYIAKPIDIDTLPDQIAKFLRKKND
jgi:two-component system cell cycle response regulator DivK